MTIMIIRIAMKSRSIFLPDFISLILKIIASKLKNLFMSFMLY